jgi:hypothetical protein
MMDDEAFAGSVLTSLHHMINSICCKVVNFMILLASFLVNLLSFHQKALSKYQSRGSRLSANSFTVFVINRRVFGKWDEDTAAASRSWKELQRIIPEKGNLYRSAISPGSSCYRPCYLVHFEG